MELLDIDSVRYFYSTQNQLKDHIYKRSQNYFDNAKKTRSSIYVKEQLEKYNHAMKDIFLNNIGGIAFDNEPLNAKVTSSKDYGEYYMENIIFTSRKDTYVTGSMYIPHGITAPTAAVLLLCGHADEGRYFSEYQIVADTLVKAGLIVFAIDPVGQGERVSYYDSEKQEYVIPPCVEDHDAIGIPATATGRFMQSYFLCDEMRAIDYMLTRPEIDPKRIGVTGNSGGGTQTMAMMAADERIAAAAPATFVTSREAYLYTGNPQDSEQIWYGITEFGYDHINPIMNIAPKPLAILAVNYDFFAIEGTLETFAEAQRFYEMYGKKENICIYRDDYGHSYTPYLALRAAEFFSKHLLGKEIHIEQHSCIQKPAEDFFNTKSGRVRNEIENAKFVCDDVNALADQLLEKRFSLSDDERLARAREWLCDKVYSHRTPYNFFLRKLKAINDGKYITEPIMWHSQKDIFNFAFMIRSSSNDGKKLPVFIAIWEDGTLKINEREALIKKKCDEGYEVMVLDVSGTGYIETASVNGGNIKDQYKTLYTLCGDLLFMNDSMVALRSWDVLRAVEMLKNVYDICESDITLYCCGDYGIYGVIAAFINQNVNVIYDNILQSVQESKIRPWGLKYNDDLCLIMPEMLKYFDYNELMR